DAGADKVVINTGALDRPELFEEVARIYGIQAVVAAVDVIAEASQSRVYDHRRRAATERGTIEWIKEAVDRGAGEIRLCSVDREGTRSGFDLDLLKRVREAVRVPVIIEGGAGSLADVDAAVKAGADGVALGTLLVFSDNNLVKVRRFLTESG